jgi:hypothetical protein
MDISSDLSLAGHGYIVGSIFRRTCRIDDIRTEIPILFWCTELRTETYIRACSRQIVVEEVKQEPWTTAHTEKDRLGITQAGTQRELIWPIFA